MKPAVLLPAAWFAEPDPRWRNSQLSGFDLQLDKGRRESPAIDMEGLTVARYS